MVRPKHFGAYLCVCVCLCSCVCMCVHTYCRVCEYLLCCPCVCVCVCVCVCREAKALLPVAENASPPPKKKQYIKRNYARPRSHSSLAPTAHRACGLEALPFIYLLYLDSHFLKLSLPCLVIVVLGMLLREFFLLTAIGYSFLLCLWKSCITSSGFKRHLESNNNITIESNYNNNNISYNNNVTAT